MQKIKIIKTLAHLQSLFLNPEKKYLISHSYSPEILSTIKNSYTLRKSEISFSKFLQIIAEIKTEDNSKNVLEEFEAGENKKYQRVDRVNESLEFSIKGDLISIWLLGYLNPIRIEFFGEDLDKIYSFDHETGIKIKDLTELIVTKNLPSNNTDISEIYIENDNKLGLDKIIFTPRELHIDSSDLEIVSTDFTFPQLFYSRFDLIQKEITRLEDNNYKVLINSQNKKYFEKSLGKYFIEKLNKKISIDSLTLEDTSLKNLAAGFISEKNKIAFFTDRELFGTIYLNKRADKTVSSSKIRKLLRQFEGEIEIGNYVVHEDYGVGIYNGLKQEEADGVMGEYLLLEFAGKDEIYVPLTQINKVTRYLGNDSETPKLTALGKGQWERLKSKVKASIYISAKELINHYVKRELSKAAAVDKNDTKEYLEFIDDFAFVETEDQMRAINEVNHDLANETPMNRLLVGDVGFGKTEVIMRAAFKIVESGGQVAILAPTTVLVAQHLNVLKERFKNTIFKIDAVSRFNTSSQNKEIIEKVNQGDIHILIGTHRLLSSDVKFRNLHFLVVDEEQKFGVKQKEKIKKLNYGVHVLSVSATPIPRSLSLALSTIQDISIITTPPAGRKPVETELIYENWERVISAIQNEIERGGQVYFVHNRVETIQAISNKIAEFIPNIKINFAHGQMGSDKLDKIITDFYLKKFQVLVSTSIIENGLDLPNVNTIILHDAHKFGLSQMYQMRGRVGRSDRQAYCYLMAPKPATDEAIDYKKLDLIEGKSDKAIQRIQLERHMAQKKKLNSQKLYLDRLQTLVDNQDLGAGFKIASKDLEIRGSGNILGAKQHGHISTIGYALYIEMLAQEIERLKNF